MIERKLTIKQQAFADTYIELGNGSEAYKRACPNVKKGETGRVNASRAKAMAAAKVSGFAYISVIGITNKHNLSLSLLINFSGDRLFAFNTCIKLLLYN